MLTKLIFFILLFSFTSCNLYSQIFRSDEERAERLYNEAHGNMMDRQYSQAERNLKRAIEIYPGHKQSYLLLGDLYARTNEYEKGTEVYKELLEIDPESIHGHYNIGYFYFNTGQYHEALEHYQELEGYEGLSSRMMENLERRIENTEYAVKLVENPVPYEPENLGPGINTQYDEYWPALTADERTLYFTRQTPRNDENGYREDIFMSRYEDGEWQKAGAPPGPLNSHLNEGAIAMSPDGRYLIFTGCNRPDVIGRCDLYKSEFVNNRWTEPENMGEPVNSPHLDRQPSISYDGRTVYFSSSRPGNKGNLDIWKTERDDDGNWQRPVNLGDVINTKGNEQAPFIHPDNETLYFVSDGHMGLGGSDIFYARKNEAGKFDTVINIGYPINTHKNSFSLTVSHSGERAFYASETEPSYGGMDIFSFELHEEARPRLTTYLQGTVYDAQTHSTLEAEFEIIDLNTGETIISSKSDAETGEFLISIPAKRDYALNVNKQGYMFHSENFSLDEYEKSDPYTQDVLLKPIHAGEAVVLENVFFALDSYDLKPESEIELNRLIRFMQENPEVKIEIHGHTDDQGTKAYNEDLSNNRARTVYNYLVEEGGISEDRLSYKGFGETQPVATNETEEGRAQNRRTEFMVLE